MYQIGNFAKAAKHIVFSSVVIIVLGLQLSSCDEAALGLDLLDEQNVLNSQFTNQIPIASSIILLDSISMDKTSRVMVGQVKEAEIGTISAEAYLLPSIGTETNINFGQDARFISLKLFLDPAYLYGDTTRNYNMAVYQLTEAMEDARVYYQFDQIPSDSEPIATFQISPPQMSAGNIEVDLDNSFGQQIFDAGGTENFSNQEAFANYIKGIKIVMEDPDADTMLGFEIVQTNGQFSPNMRMNLRYEAPTDQGTIDTLGLNLFFDGPRFHHTTYQPEGALAPLAEGREVPTSDFGNRGLVVAGIGLTTKITFPSTPDLQALIGNSIINEADFILSPTSLIQRNNKPIPPSLRMRKLDVFGNFILNDNQEPLLVFQDGFAEEPRLPTEFVANGNVGTYSRVDLTSYLQDIINGRAHHEVLLNPSLDRVSVNSLIFADADFPTATQDSTGLPPPPEALPLRVDVSYTRLNR